MISTLSDIRRPSGAVVAPAATWAGEHAWYSASGSEKHQAGMSTFSIGALIVAEKLDSMIVKSSAVVDGASAMTAMWGLLGCVVRRWGPARLRRRAGRGCARGRRRC